MRGSIYRFDDIAPIEAAYVGNRFAAFATCHLCGSRGEWNARNQPPADLLPKKFRQMGWDIGKSCTCPECLANAKEANKEKKTVATQISPAAMKAQARMMTMLMEQFNAETGLYASGWDDARVAKETSLALDHVKAFRVAAFGELKEPDAISVLRADMISTEKALIALAEDVRREMTALRARLDGLAQQFKG